jgi:hypothetical protein
MGLQAMFLVATEGKPDPLEGSSWSAVFRDFIAKLLTFDVCRFHFDPMLARLRASMRSICHVLTGWGCAEIVIVIGLISKTNVQEQQSC